MNHPSKSKRTVVSVDLNDDGSGVVIVTQDSNTINRFDIPAEQAGPDGEPKSDQVAREAAEAAAKEAEEDGKHGCCYFRSISPSELGSGNEAYRYAWER